MLKFSSAGALTEYRYTVADDVVIVQRDSATASSEATYFLFKDHLGSVFTTLASTGAIVSQQVFSAFGQTRSIHTSSAVSLGLMMAPTEQGFTGHRQMDALGIVHMKGRIYDPTIGRFLQADPFIQAPKNSQNYNRYSYVLNNPLRYTDPSGYNFFEKILRPFKHIIRGVFKVLGANFSNALVTVGSVFCGPWAPVCAAAGTYDVARAHGASSKDARRAGAAAGATQWVFGLDSGMSFQQATIQVGAQTIAASNPQLGQALMYVTGSWGLDPSGWAQNAVGQYAQYKTQKELARFAAKNGMTLQELNLLLGLNSKLGLAFAGTTYDPDNSTVEGFASRRTYPSLGILWDINDTLLNAQGLLDAVSMSVVNSGYTGHLTGHSLGAWRVNNLVRMGLIDSGTLLSLPGFAYPATGTTGICSSLDMICGTGVMTSLRLGTTSVSSPSWWDWLNKNHRICSVQGYQNEWSGTCP